MLQVFMIMGFLLCIDGSGDDNDDNGNVKKLVMIMVCNGDVL